MARGKGEQPTRKSTREVPVKRAREDDADTDGPAVKRARGRPKKSETPAKSKPGPKAKSNANGDDTPKRGRGRPKGSGSGPKTPKTPKTPSIDPLTGKPRGRGRPSKASMEAAGTGTKKTAGRGRKAGAAPSTPKATGKPRGRKPKAQQEEEAATEAEGEEVEDETEDAEAVSEDGEEAEVDGEEETEQDGDGAANDDEGDDDEDQADGEEEDEEEYATDRTGPPASPTRAAAIAYVPQTTVLKKWGPLDASAQARARSLYASVALPVIAAAGVGASSVVARDVVHESGPAAEAQAVLNKTMRTISKRLAKQPFPPRSSAQMFEHEALLRDRTAMERAVVVQTGEVAGLARRVKQLDVDVETAEREAEALQGQYDAEKERMEHRHKDGRHATWLRMPEEEPRDSARRIKLAPWVEGGGGDDGVEARAVMGVLQGHLAEIDSEDMAEEKLEADIDRASAVIDRMLRLRRQEPGGAGLVAA